MKKSTILKKARKYIASGSENYVCYAIMRSVPDKYDDVSVELRGWVMSLLGYCHTTYGSWLYDRHPEVYRRMGLSDMREARLQWVDWMIKYWEAEEKKR